MKKVLIIALAVALPALAAQFMPDSESRNTAHSEYTLTVRVSDSNVTHYQHKTSAPSVTVKDLLTGVNVEFATEQRDAETVTQVDGIVATASKGWIPHVNNQPTTLEHQVNPQDVVEIKYTNYE